MIMKRLFTILAASFTFALTVSAGDRPVTYSQLPVAAQTFIQAHYPQDKVSFATIDDDIIRPDYNVVLVSGVRLEFCNSGQLKKIEARQGGVPVNIIPVQIRDYANTYYPGTYIVDYEIGKRTYDVKLSNRLELKFNKRFQLVEVDD